jgi:hypothetical protein
MAIVVLVLWMFTAGAGVYVLVTSNLGRARPAASPERAGLTAQMASAVAPSASSTATPSGSARREARRAARNRWDPPSLAAAKSAPVVPGFRSLMEFVHPACGIIGLAFWLGFTLIHSRPLGWIAFGLVAVTACAGLSWFAANVRAARRQDPAEPPPSFNGRVIALHGAAAALTLTLAALTALIARG